MNKLQDIKKLLKQKGKLTAMEICRSVGLTLEGFDRYSKELKKTSIKTGKLNRGYRLTPQGLKPYHFEETINYYSLS